MMEWKITRFIVDALGTHARHRPKDIRGLAGSMRALAGRATF